jgi:hypothetical protein
VLLRFRSLILLFPRYKFIIWLELTLAIQYSPGLFLQGCQRPPLTDPIRRSRFGQRRIHIRRKSPEPSSEAAVAIRTADKYLVVWRQRLRVQNVQPSVLWIRNTLLQIRIRIRLFTLMRIRIRMRLLNLMWIRIRILLLIKVMQICNHWSTVYSLPPQCARPRLNTAPFRASKTPEL